MGPGREPRVHQSLALLLRLPTSSFLQVLECPRLMETIVQEFLPITWSPVRVGPTPSLYKVPCAAAMKLLRVLASAGRNIAARLVSRTWVKGWGHESWKLSRTPEF